MTPVELTRRSPPSSLSLTAEKLGRTLEPQYVAPKELFNSFSTRHVSLGISSIPSPRASYSLNSKSVWAIATYVYDRRVLGKLVVSKASAW